MVKQRGRGAPVGGMVPTLLLFVLLPVGYAVFTAVRGGDDGSGSGRPKLSRDGSKEVSVPEAERGRPLRPD